VRNPASCRSEGVNQYSPFPFHLKNCRRFCKVKVFVRSRRRNLCLSQCFQRFFQPRIPQSNTWVVCQRTNSSISTAGSIIRTPLQCFPFKNLWDKPHVDCEKTRVACRVKPVRLATRLTRQALFLRGHAMAKIKVGYWVYESLYIAETYIQIETASVIRSEFLGVRTE
jgi:hypothetical protein